jgi:hypothetical protein
VVIEHAEQTDICEAARKYKLSSFRINTVVWQQDMDRIWVLHFNRCMILIFSTFRKLWSFCQQAKRSMLQLEGLAF